ncbi:nucleoside recognition protein [Clostridiaceae bacterium 35-E11]
MIEVMKEALWGSFQSVYSMAVIVIPMMIALQMAKDYQLLSKIAEWFRFITRLLGISKDAIFPLLVGVFFGISYGAGVIIESSREGNLNKKDLFLVVIFLVTCHGIVEDTLIFMAIGANGFLLVTLRIATAICLTYLLSKKLKFQDISHLTMENIQESKH